MHVPANASGKVGVSTIDPGVEYGDADVTGFPESTEGPRFRPQDLRQVPHRRGGWRPGRGADPPRRQVSDGNSCRELNRRIAGQDQLEVPRILIPLESDDADPRTRVSGCDPLDARRH